MRSLESSHGKRPGKCTKHLVTVASSLLADINQIVAEY
jgi:hypothetical protein